MTIPLLLVCDGEESKQATLEGLVKNEPGLKYIATASMQEGSRAVERAVKVGAKLIWIDLDEEPVEGLNLLAETRKLHPMLNVIVSRTQLDPDMVRAALQLGAIDFLDPARAAQQLNVVVENLRASGLGQATSSQQNIPAQPTAQPVAPQPQGAPGANASLTTGGGGKWGDLDSIGAPGSKSPPPFNQDVTGEIHVASSGIQNLVASQTGANAVPAAAVAPAAGSAPAAASAPAPAAMPTARPTTELPAGGSKWGDLDSIGAPAASAPAPAPAPVASAPPAPAPVASAPPAPAPAAAAPPISANPAPPQAPPVAPQPAPAAAPAASANNPNGGRWGDLDAIPTPKAAQEPPAPKPTAEMTKPLSDLDAIPSPVAKPAVERPPLPKPEPHNSAIKALRPSPEKAELYSMGSPVLMAVVIIVIIFGAIAFVYFSGHHH